MDSKKIEQFLLREQEYEQRGEFLATARAEMGKKGASERSIHIALTGLHEYILATATYPEPPHPGSRHIPVAGGRFLSDIPSRPVDWLWQDRIPLAALTLLEGGHGIGKSLLALDLAACVSSGRPMPDGTPGKQGTVVLIAPHDSATHTIIPRLRAAGGDPSEVFLLTTVLDVNPKNGQQFGRPFSLSDDEHLLEEIVTRTEAVLAIIDTLDICQPLKRHRGLPQLVRLAEHTGCAIVLTRPRTTSRPAQDSPVHSTAPLDLRAFVSSSLLIAPDPKDNQQRFPITTRHPLAPRPKTLSYEFLGPPNGAPVINWLGAAEHPDSPTTGGPSGKLGIIRILTLAALKDASAALSARDLSRSDEEYQNVRKLLNRMLHAGEVVSPARGLYTLPGHPCLDRSSPIYRGSPCSTPPPQQHPLTPLSQMSQLSQTSQLPRQPLIPQTTRTPAHKQHLSQTSQMPPQHRPFLTNQLGHGKAIPTSSQITHRPQPDATLINILDEFRQPNRVIPVGTGGGCGEGWGPGACPGGHMMRQGHVRHEGHILRWTGTRPPHPLHPLSLQDASASIPRFVRQHSLGPCACPGGPMMR